MIEGGISLWQPSLFTHLLAVRRLNQTEVSFVIVTSSASLVATLLELTFNKFPDIPHNEVLCFFQVQSGYLYGISSTKSFASSNVFQCCHYPNDPIDVTESFIVNESRVCCDCGLATGLFLSWEWFVLL